MFPSRQLAVRCILNTHCPYTHFLLSMRFGNLYHTLALRLEVSHCLLSVRLLLGIFRNQNTFLSHFFRQILMLVFCFPFRFASRLSQTPAFVYPKLLYMSCYLYPPTLHCLLLRHLLCLLRF